MTFRHNPADRIHVVIDLSPRARSGKIRYLIVGSRTSYRIFLLLGIGLVANGLKPTRLEAGSPVACVRNFIQTWFKPPPPEVTTEIQELEGNLRDFIPNTKRETQEIAKKTLRALKELAIAQDPRRLNGLNRKQADELYIKVLTNPVAGPGSLDRYDPSGSIGFCFGRAMATHLFALQMGVNKLGIRKIWALGKFYEVRDYQISKTHGWSYHVATIVRDDVGGWWAIDPTLAVEPMKVEEWIKKMNSLSLDQNTAIITTKASRFLTDNSKPHPRRMTGMSSNIENYYKDLLKWFRAESSEIRRDRNHHE